MPDTQLLLLASGLRVHAEEVLAKAETYHDADARHMMHDVAACYVKLAEQVKQQADAA